MGARAQFLEQPCDTSSATDFYPCGKTADKENSTFNLKDTLSRDDSFVMTQLGRHSTVLSSLNYGLRVIVTFVESQLKR